MAKPNINKPDTAYLVLPLMLYGAGDPGTEALIGALKRAGVEFVFRDTRDPDRVALTYVLKHDHTTLPQLYDCANNYIGDYDQASSWLAQRFVG